MYADLIKARVNNLDRDIGSTLVSAQDGGRLKELRPFLHGGKSVIDDA